MLVLQIILQFRVLPFIFLILRIFISHNDHNLSLDVEMKNSVRFEPKISEVDQLNALAQMRLLAGGLLDDTGHNFYQSDRYLLSWLKSRHFNVNDATRMALEAREWRLKNRVDDSILNETIISYPIHPFQFGGFDKEGHPLGLLTIKPFDTRKILLTTKREDVVRSWIQNMERAYNAIIHNKRINPINKKPIEGMLGIIDADGASLKQHMCLKCKKKVEDISAYRINTDYKPGLLFKDGPSCPGASVYLEAGQILENYYPGMVYRIIAVNVNRAGMNFVNFITPFISADLRNSVKLFGANQTEWKEYLLTIISPDQLPPQFGGIKVS